MKRYTQDYRHDWVDDDSGEWCKYQDHAKEVANLKTENRLLKEELATWKARFFETLRLIENENTT